MKRVMIFLSVFAAFTLGFTAVSYAQTALPEEDPFLEPADDDEIIPDDEILPDDEIIPGEEIKPDDMETEPSDLVDPTAIKEFDDKVEQAGKHEDFINSWMEAPFTTGHKNGIYSLAGYGRMESTEVLEVGGIEAYFDYMVAFFGGELDNDPNFDGSYAMIELGGRYGIIENLEAGLRFTFSGWDGAINVYNLPLNTEGGTGFGDLFIDAKYNLGDIKEMLLEDFPIDVAALLTIKLPTGSQNDAISTGALDFSVNILATYSPMENLGVHLMLGFTAAFDGDIVQPEETRTWGFLGQFGLGATYRVIEMLAVALQFEFYDPALDMTLGFKGYFEVSGFKVLPELGFTIGLYTQAADFTMKLGTTVLF